MFFFLNTQILKFVKIRPVGAELLQADRWTDGEKNGYDEASSRFSKFCEHA
jgi:hypothetical protein